MARSARVVVPNVPHHITQRGNRKQEVFFQKGDYLEYLNLMRKWCDDCGVAVWAYCLMPNHIHLIAVPEDTEGLARAISQAHVAYTRMINFRNDWRGYLWQGRFASYPMNEAYMYNAIRYIERNPIRAGIVKFAEDYPWSSAHAHIDRVNDDLVTLSPSLDLSGWKNWLREEEKEETQNQIQRHISTGRPLGDDDFIDCLEKRFGRKLRPAKRGPKGPRIIPGTHT